MLQIHIGSSGGKFPLVCFALLLAGCLVPTPSEAQIYQLVHSFTGAPDGAMPAAALMFDTVGNLYGTTAFGGGDGNDGTVFTYNSSGVESVLIAFDAATNGAYPQGPLAIDGNGNLYGAALEGGAYGLGTLFEISEGSLTVLYNFEFGGVNYLPTGGLVLDSAGNLYGVDEGTDNPIFAGALFQFSLSGIGTTLHIFGLGDGSLPKSGPLRDTAGNLFGTTARGGQSNCPNANSDIGCGIVYEYSANGIYSVLYAFTNNGVDGFFPLSTPVIDSEGNLYGTTYGGGVNGLGVVFELSPVSPTVLGGEWKETILHEFSGGKDGAHPISGLVLDSQGNVYGTTYEGGTAGYGTVFRISSTKSRTKTVLHYFTGAPNDGAYPAGALSFDSQGNLYGTTQTGGSSNLGTLYKLSQ